MSEQIKRGAVMSDCGDYRYWLERSWGPSHPQVFVMLNPSTADANIDDRTIGRCVEFAKREGCGGIIVVNLFALRSTDPKGLIGHSAPVGPENGVHIGSALVSAAGHSRPVICGWGGNVLARPEAERLKRRALDFGVRLKALHINRDGSPKHPLYIKGNAPLVDL